MRKRCPVFFLIFFWSLFLFCTESPRQYSLPEIIKIGLKNNPSILAKEKEVAAKKAVYQSSKLLQNPEIEYGKGRGQGFETEKKINTGKISIQQPFDLLKIHLRENIESECMKRNGRLLNFRSIFPNWRLFII